MDSQIINWEFILRLVLSGFLAGFIGLERESHGRPAGLRTHILVSVGSCLIMLISIYGFLGPANRDPARLAAQVISGIGFLGAGTIMREGITVKGLTTAASLWVVSGIGLAVGTGFYFIACITTLIAVLTLIFLEPLERKLFRVHAYHLIVELGDDLSRLPEITQSLTHSGFELNHLEFDFDEKNHKTVLELIVSNNRKMDRNRVILELAKIKGIQRLNLK